MDKTMAFLSASALFQCSLLLDSTHKKDQVVFYLLFPAKVSRKGFCCLGVFFPPSLSLSILPSGYFSSYFSAIGAVIFQFFISLLYFTVPEEQSSEGFL